MKKLSYKKSVLAVLGFTLLGGLSGGIQAASPDGFIGSISYVGFNFTPRGFAKCDGQLLSIGQNQSLFSLLGTTFGGDGRSSFGLPDMRGRVPIHAGSGPGLKQYRLGEKGGFEKTTLSVANLASHDHTLAVASVSTSALMAVKSNGGVEKPTGNSIAKISGQSAFSTSAPNVAMNTSSVITTTTTKGTAGNTGDGQSFTNIQPYLTLNCVIALSGSYPQRI